jgi:hypothetical protein
MILIFMTDKLINLHINWKCVMRNDTNRFEYFNKYISIFSKALNSHDNYYANEIC